MESIKRRELICFQAQPLLLRSVHILSQLFYDDYHKVHPLTVSKDSYFNVLSYALASEKFKVELTIFILTDIKVSKGVVCSCLNSAQR